MRSRYIHASIVRRAVAVLALLILTGCTSAPGRQAQPAQRSADEIYKSGRSALLANRYDTAAMELRSLEVLYPENPHADQAQMELAYAYLKNQDYSSSIATAERFIRRHPDHANADYMYYLRGLASYEQTLAILGSMDITDDEIPATVAVTLEYFTALKTRFPDSKYTADGLSRSAQIRERIAQITLAAAKRHLSEGDYVGAARRARAVTDRYPGTGSAKEAATVAEMAAQMIRRTASEWPTDGAMAPESPDMPDSALQPMTEALPASAHADNAGPSLTTPAAVAVTALPTLPTSPTIPEAPALPARPEMVTPTTEPAGTPRLRREAWLNEQDPAAYTIQVLGSENRRSLVGFAKRYGLESQAAYFETRRNGKPWHALVYGTYATLTEAKTAMKELPIDVQSRHPWIRNISDVQAAITLTALERNDASASDE